MPDLTRLAFFGGIYNNWLALAKAVGDARRPGVDALYALGDFAWSNRQDIAEIEALMGADMDEHLAAPETIGRATRIDSALAGRHSLRMEVAARGASMRRSRCAT